MGKGLSGVGDVALHVLADDGLLVLAGHVVPLDAVAVEVVEDGQAGLGVSAVLNLLSVVRLDTWWVESAKKVITFYESF